MARPIYQYKPKENGDTALGILLPLNKDAKGKSIADTYNSSVGTGKGVFESSYTTEEAVLSNLKNLLLTSKGQRYMQPKFGTSINTVLFENNTDDVRELLMETMSEDIKYWLPYVQLLDIEIATSKDRHSMSLRLSFRIDSIGANIVINVLANENSLQVDSVERGEILNQVGTFGSGTAFNTGLGGSY